MVAAAPVGAVLCFAAAVDRTFFSSLCLALLVTMRVAHADGDPASVELGARRAQLASARGAERVFAILEASALDELALDGGVDLLAFLQEAIRSVEDPLVRAQARWELSGMLDRRGKREEAQRVRAPLGLVDSNVAFVGPFVVERGAELPVAEVLPPESTLLTAALTSDTRWAVGAGGAQAQVRELPRDYTAGMLPIGVLVRPDVHVAAYVIVTLSSTKAQTVAVRVGSTGALAAWMNGRTIGGRTGDRQPTLDADAYGARLRAGLNRLVVRVATDDRRPELILRVTDAKGDAAPGVAVVPPAEAREALPLERATGPLAVRTLEASLSKAERDAYVVLQGSAGPRPEAVCDRIATHLALYPPERALALQLRCAADADARRRVLEDRLRLLERTKRPEPDANAARLRLAEHILHSRTPQLGESLLARAANGDERNTWRARLRLAELDSDRGLPSLAQAKMDALYRVAPARRLQEALAQLAFRRGQRQQALVHYRALLQQWPGDTSARRQLASYQKAGGRAEDLAAALSTLDAPFPLRDLETVLTDRAELREGVGDSRSAEADLRSALTYAPDDSRVEERLGRLLLGHGAREEALAHLEKALRLRPQNPELRGVLADLAHAGRDDLARRFAVDVLALRKRAAAEPLGRDEPSRVLYDSVTVRVHANGLEESFSERVVEIGDSRGAERESATSIRFAPDSQTVEVRSARVYKKNGDLVDAASIDEQDLSEPWAGLFYDMRAQVVSLPGLEPGDVVHVAYTVADHGRRNELGESFSGLYMLTEKQVRLESRYRLIAPAARTFYFNTPIVDGVALSPSTFDEGEERRYEFVARRVPKLAVEPGMPGDTDSGGYVHVSTFADWGEVARLYRGLMRTQLETDGAIRQAARDAVRGKKRVDDKVAAIYDLVVRSTRYVGLEFGIHGYQPYSVCQVWARRFGDCKDKASLLVAMLKEVGVPATLVLLRTRHEGAVKGVPASLAPFNHAIAYVPSLDRYLDGTAELSGSTELPGQDQGVAVLHVDEGKLRTSPVFGAEASIVESSVVVTAAGDGSARVRERRTVRGQSAENWRRQYQAVAPRKERYGKAWSERSPGAEVESIELAHLADREQPVSLVAVVRAPHLGRVDETGLAFPVLAREPWMLAAFARLSKRKEDLEIAGAFTDRERVRFVFPRSARLRLPAPVELESAFGRFTMKYVPASDGVEVVAETVLATRRVAATDYPAFRTFLADIDRALGAQIRVEMPR